MCFERYVNQLFIRPNLKVLSFYLDKCENGNGRLLKKMDGDLGV